MGYHHKFAPAPNPPCKGCKDRSVKTVDGKVVRCHSTCEKYKAFEAERRKILDDVNKINHDYWDVHEYEVERATKVKKYKRSL